jgi:DNA invertase Pin-like site-specific DNA recombinase
VRWKTRSYLQRSDRGILPSGRPARSVENREHVCPITVERDFVEARIVARAQEHIGDGRRWLGVGRLARQFEKRLARWSERLVGIRPNSRARPALKELCDHRRTYAAVVVPKLSRFGRSMAHLFEMYTSFSEDGVDLIFLDVGVDSSTSQGKLLRNVMSAFAEYESDVRSDYAKTNAEHAARLGRPNGMAPLGYRYRGRGLGLEVVEEKARIVRHIFNSYTRGEPILSIARRLDADGYRSPRGKR